MYIYIYTCIWRTYIHQPPAPHRPGMKGKDHFSSSCCLGRPLGGRSELVMESHWGSSKNRWNPCETHVKPTWNPCETHVKPMWNPMKPGISMDSIQVANTRDFRCLSVQKTNSLGHIHFPWDFTMKLMDCRWRPSSPDGSKLVQNWCMMLEGASHLVNVFTPSYMEYPHSNIIYMGLYVIYIWL